MLHETWEEIWKLKLVLSSVREAMRFLVWKHLDLSHWKRGLGYFLNKELPNIYCSGINGNHESLTLVILSFAKSALSHLSQVTHGSTSGGSKLLCPQPASSITGFLSSHYLCNLNLYGIQPALLSGHVLVLSPQTRCHPLEHRNHVLHSIFPQQCLAEP